METLAALKDQIRSAFAAVQYPGDWCLINSREGTEPILLEQEFKGKDDWRILDASFIDRAPDGFGTSLSFFSDEAFHYYLPAYLLADLDGLLQQADPVFHLTYGLDRKSGSEKINPKRYGERTWLDHAHHKHAMFNAQERAAISSYLSYKRDNAALTDFEKRQIDDALGSYWNRKEF